MLSDEATITVDFPVSELEALRGLCNVGHHLLSIGTRMTLPVAPGSVIAPDGAQRDLDMAATRINLALHGHAQQQATLQQPRPVPQAGAVR